MSKARLISGLALILLYCLIAAFADAGARTVAQEFDAPQLFFFSGLIGVFLSYAMIRTKKGAAALRPKRPGLLALRSAFFVISCVSYYYAFRSLMFAEVFAFVALVPIFAALLSGPVLKEPLRMVSWAALLIGVLGMLVMYPPSKLNLTAGHVFALMGAIFGAFSMVMARLISRSETNSLLQVFYPNLAIAVVMGFWLPFAFRPMGWDTGLIILSYGVLLFAARWVLVLALTRLPAYVATPLINVQFIFMLAIGFFMFGEMPLVHMIIGALIVIAGGVMLIVDQLNFAGRDEEPAEAPVLRKPALAGSR